MGRVAGLHVTPPSEVDASCPVVVSAHPSDGDVRLRNLIGAPEYCKVDHDTPPFLVPKRVVAPMTQPS
jgi:hypothetical protein